ncbi:MAG: MFS transporter [Lachnospiraceae bacterium]|nr:MFS transporter [Lachnospiraceae bacterium]
MNKITARKQIKKLLLLDSAGSFMIAGASWVALLYARGFSTIEIGFAESIFHVASLMFEIPSGAVADVFGRKKVMVASRIMSVIAAVIMIFSNGFAGVAIAMLFSALSYNLASGTREALAYDSLKAADIEDEYEKFASNDLIIYQITSSAATLLAGVALMLGYRRAYALDVIIALESILITLSLKEVESGVSKEMGVWKRFIEVAQESFLFLKNNRRTRLIIVFNATTGAVSMLILFFLQAKLPSYGLPKVWLGPALFGMGLGAALGPKVIQFFPNYRYRAIAGINLAGVAFTIGMLLTGKWYLILIGGFVASFSDSFLEVRTDVVLNNMIPSEQRATLMSIKSFTYSLVMILLSPVFGWLFS